MTTLFVFLLGLGFSFVFVIWRLMAAVFLWFMFGDGD